MKNTLAENMLRFGVKNLTESNRKKLQEQPTEPAAPAAKAAPAAAKPATTPAAKTETKKFEVAFTCANGNTKFPGFARAFANKQPDGTFKPGSVIVTYPKGTAGTPTIFRLINTNNVYSLDPSGVIPNPEKLVEFIKTSSRIDKGLLPVSAITQALAQLAQATGTKLALDPATRNAFAITYQNSNNRVGKYSGKLTGILAAFGIAELVQYLNPETSAIMHKELWLGDGVKVADNSRTFEVDNGQLVPAHGNSTSNTYERAKSKNPDVVWKDLKQAILTLYTQLDSQPAAAPVQATPTAPVKKP